MAEMIFQSGQYRRYSVNRRINVPFFARKARIPNISKAFKGDIRKIEIKLNGEKITDWMVSENAIHFGKTLLRGEYWLFIEITYNDLDPVVYKRWNE